MLGGYGTLKISTGWVTSSIWGVVIKDFAQIRGDQKSQTCVHTHVSNKWFGDII